MKNINTRPPTNYPSGWIIASLIFYVTRLKRFERAYNLLRTKQLMLHDHTMAPGQGRFAGTGTPAVTVLGGLSSRSTRAIEAGASDTAGSSPPAHRQYVTIFISFVLINSESSNLLLQGNKSSVAMQYRQGMKNVLQYP